MVPRRRQHKHEELQDLSMYTVYCLLAALMQCLSMACLCVAISLLKWITVLQPIKHRPRVFVSNSFGVPFEMAVSKVPGKNETVTGKLYFFAEEEDNVMEVMITICLLSLIFGFMAFLLDFVEIKRLGQKQAAITTFLHVLSGIFIITQIILCCWCLLKIKKQIGGEGWKIFKLKVAPGESFYVILMCLVLIIIAVILRFRAMRPEDN